jgi:hypothetical protein
MQDLWFQDHLGLHTLGVAAALNGSVWNTASARTTKAAANQDGIVLAQEDGAAK